MYKWILFLSLIACLLTGCTPPEENAPTIVPNQPFPMQAPQTPATSVTKPYIPTTPFVPSFGSVAGRVIVVDAGHGGKDPGSQGTVYSTMAEKKINLSIANELARQLKSMGAKVIMTRASDKFIELEDRAGVAERYKADLFVSVHSNSHPDKTRSGVVVYTSRNRSQQSRWACLALYYAIQSAGIKCEADQADYKVLVEHSKPAVLVECGYLSNYSDCKKLNSSTYRCKVAAAIAQGIGSYFGKH